jgi:CheY-like chemotaxis protein
MTKILVIDDESDTADGLAFLFERLGHDVRVAYSGASALPLAAAFLPHIIFLDLSMPGVDGYEAARQIRAAAPVTDHPFLVAHSGMGGPEINKLTKAAGFDVYIVKPADFSILLMLVDNLKDREHPSKPTSDKSE